VLVYTARAAQTVARELSKPRIGLLDAVTTTGRAWPWHCDVNFHLNNASYAMFMEMGRWAWMVRTGLLPRVRRLRCSFVLAGCSEVYRREVPLLSTFRITTRLCAADQRFAIFDQTVWLPNGMLACQAYQRVMSLTRKGVLAPEELAGQPLPAIENAELMQWLESQQAVLTRHKQSISDRTS